MGIMTRVLRLCRADLHGVIDQLEDDGLMLKQHLREMEEELGRKESWYNRMVRARDQAVRDLKAQDRETEALERDLDAAVARDKDDIARMLIRKLKNQGRRREELNRHILALDTDLAQAGVLVEEQRLQYEELRLRAGEFFQVRERETWAVGPAGGPERDFREETMNEEVELELARRKETARRAGRGGGAL